MKIFDAKLETYMKVVIGTMIIVALINFVPQLQQLKQGV